MRKKALTTSSIRVTWQYSCVCIKKTPSDLCKNSTRPGHTVLLLYGSVDRVKYDA